MDRRFPKTSRTPAEKLYLGRLWGIEVFVSFGRTLCRKIRERQFQVDLNDLSVRTKARARKLLLARQKIDHEEKLRFLADEVEISVEEFSALVRAYKEKNPSLKLKDFF